MESVAIHKWWNLIRIFDSLVSLPHTLVNISISFPASQCYSLCEVLALNKFICFSVTNSTMAICASLL